MVKPSYFTRVQRGYMPLWTFIAFLCIFIFSGCDNTVTASVSTPKETVAVPQVSSTPNSVSPTHSLNVQPTVPVQITPAPSNLSTNTPSASLFITPLSNLPEVDLTTAWGKNALTHDVPTVMTDNKHSFVYETITPDAQFVLGLVTNPNFGSEVSKVVLLNVANQQIDLVQKLTDPQAQIVGSAADNDWIVWSVATQQPNFGDWTIYSYNRQTHQISTIAKAPTASDGQLIPGPLNLPKVDHGIVVWSEGYVNKLSSLAVPTIIKSYDLKNGQQSILAKNGFGPVISWPNIAWTQSSDIPNTEVQGALKSSIVIKNLETSEQKTLRYPDSPRFFYLSGNTIVWVDAVGYNLYLSDTSDSVPQLIIHTTDTDIIQFPTVNERIVAWSSYTKNQVFDRKQNRLITLSNVESLVQAGLWQSQTTAYGKAFVWLSVNNEQPSTSSGKTALSPSRIYKVIDITQLPITPP